jgi:hypothetical protein
MASRTWTGSLGVRVCALGLALAAGCGGDGNKQPIPVPGPGVDPLYLTIIGAKDVMMVEGQTVSVTVQYHDAQGIPITGPIQFAFGGNAQGASVDPSVLETDPSGTVQVNVTAGTQGTFGLSASATRATPAQWNLHVGPAPTGPLSYAGTYHLESTFDVSSGFSDGYAMSTPTLSGMTDGAYDPATWLIDLILARIDNRQVDQRIAPLRPDLDRSLNDQMTAATPNILATLRAAPIQLAQVSHAIGLGSELMINLRAASGGTMNVVQTHTLKSLIITVNSMRVEVPLTAMGLVEPTARDIAGGGVDVPRALRIGHHQFTFNYGRILQVALERVITPTLDSTATSFADFLSHQMDCNMVSETMQAYASSESDDPNYWRYACQDALVLGAQNIGAELIAGDRSAAQLDLTGNATLADHDGNMVADAIENGRWRGSFRIGNRVSPLVDGGNNTFTGTRTSP